MAEKLGLFKRIKNEFLYKCINKNCNSVKKNKNKLSVNFNKNLYKCWVCGWSGSINKLVNHFKHDSAFISDWKSLDSTYVSRDFSNLFKQEELREIKEKLELPENFISLVGNGSILAKPAIDYLKKRSWTQEDINFFKPGYCLDGKYAGRIIFSSFDLEGELNFFTSRTYTNQEIPYIKCSADNKNIIFNELYIDWEKPIVLVEGIFDAVRAGETAIPILGSSLNQTFRLFREIVKNSPIVYMALDPDADDKAIKIAKEFLKYDVMVYKVNIQPYKDIGEMPKEEVKKRIEEAKSLNENIFLYNIYSILNKGGEN